MIYVIFFFFSSRRRHTRWPRDWSSDVCSSDLSRSQRSVSLRVRQEVQEMLRQGLRLRSLGSFVLDERAPSLGGSPLWPLSRSCAACVTEDIREPGLPAAEIVEGQDVA